MALPCPGGTTMQVGVTMESEEDCPRCGVGTFCPVGSGAATACSAGTYNDQDGQETCRKCAAGTSQGAEGATVCVVCEPGEYSVLTTHYSLLTPHSLLTIHHSLLTIHHSPLTTHYSIPTRYYRTTYYSPIMNQATTARRARLLLCRAQV